MMPPTLRAGTAPALLAVAGLLVQGCSFLIGTPVLDDWQCMRASEVSAHPDPVTVTHLGVTTLLIRHGETAILTDGFFSRPGRLAVLFDRKVEPDVCRIEQGLEMGGIDRLDAILVLHSHYDHAMDVAEVAKRTGAPIYGSKSTAYVALSSKIPSIELHEVQLDTPIEIDPFKVTFIESDHLPLRFRKKKMLDTRVDKELPLPAPTTAYGEGVSYSIRIEHAQGTAVVQGSAGFLENALDHVDADVVLLGIGLLGNQSLDYFNDFWKHVVGAVDADRILPVHWDDPTRPLSVPPRSNPGILDNVDCTLRRLVTRSHAEDRRVELLPIGRPVPLFTEEKAPTCPERVEDALCPSGAR